MCKTAFPITTAYSQSKVFKILWSEPSGSTGTEITKLNSTKYGETSFSSIRRFVIIKTLEGHSICLYVPPLVSKCHSSALTMLKANSNVRRTGPVEEWCQARAPLYYIYRRLSRILQE